MDLSTSGYLGGSACSGGPAGEMGGAMELEMAASGTPGPGLEDQCGGDGEYSCCIHLSTTGLCSCRLCN